MVVETKRHGLEAGVKTGCNVMSGVMYPYVSTKF